jgi:hypothetical protein
VEGWGRERLTVERLVRNDWKFFLKYGDLLFVLCYYQQQAVSGAAYFGLHLCTTSV